MASALLELDEVSVDYGSRRRPIRVVHGVSLDVQAAETVGLVGESGSGKTTIGRAVVGLVPVAAGAIRFDGEDITRATAKRRRQLTSEIQVIYQDPYGSLNPARTVGSTLAEPLSVHKHRLSRREVEQRVSETLTMVGLPPAAAGRYPAEFSGGQRQRIAVARAVIARPRLIVCDEPVSALDLSVQAQVLNLLEDLRERLGVSYLFISHDLSVVDHIAARIAVLYHGQLVENGDADQVSSAPAHPYTALLQTAAPIPDPAEQRIRRAAFKRRLEELESCG